MFMHLFPRDDVSLKSQTSLTNIDNETYHGGYIARPSTLRDRLIQVTYFVIFFGWLRLIILITSTVAFCISIIPIYVFHRTERVRRWIVPPAEWIAKRYIRIVCWCLGVYWISVHGKPDPKTRCFTYNHVTLLDGPLFYMYAQFTIVMTAGILSVPYFGKAMVAAQAMFIDRRKTDGNSKVLSDGIRNHAIFPVAVAPEAKISNGDYLFRFRRGAFLTDEQLQPATIRYREFLTCANISLNSLPDSDLEWLWLSLCIPFSVCDLTFLDPLPPEKIAGMSPQQKADMVQLIMANSLGTLASSRSSHEIFGLKRKDD
jgi:1-acyl-sn-glycerol-3-phosphate acyltransferase